MGFGVNNVQTLVNLRKNFPELFHSKAKVLEFGDQKIYVGEEILQQLSQNNLELKNSYPYDSKILWNALGVQNVKKVDGFDAPGVINLNLNDLTIDLNENFDIVTDLGNNEHLFFPGNAYRVMHNCTNVGGLIWIDQMLINGNGMWNYEKNFFYALAQTNKYKIIEAYYVVGHKHGLPNQFKLPINVDLLKLINFNSIASLGIGFIFQKKYDEKFVIPHQIPTGYGTYTYVNENDFSLFNTPAEDIQKFKIVSKIKSKMKNIELISRLLFK